ncbi:Uroporphyrinogen-III methyltransferase [Serinicoccus hydrothermalis]|uniref:uroporphyrinogen-III C-methyltransferase n=1 Tax=Serinicoccus hydrothermalis TaxID=1758689 RepID=A0A1B1NBP9_9MICO|nr:uroporphyrinogen-III synthase [Serinicoccus hydrothermalis]ANS78824.1 Uroporphyrinogen-III methyltransferase [Serinicoccus hydrothermalis]
MSTDAAPVHLTPVPSTAARVAFVGAGPGDPGLLTVRARDYLAVADVVVVDAAHREDQVRAWTGEDTEIVRTVRGEDGPALSPAARAKLLVRTATRFDDATHLVVRLLSEDSAGGTMADEARACHDAGVAFEIVPGVSAAWAVPAYAGMLPDGDGGQVHVVSAADTGVDWSHSVDDEVTVVVLGERDRLHRALQHLADAGRDAGTPTALTGRGTTNAQQTRVTTLHEALAADAEELAGATVAVVGRPVQLRAELSWWESKPLFGWSILVPRTKEQSGPMTDRISGYGASSSVVPTISVEKPRTPQQMDRAVKGLVTGRYEWIGFTSVNAVRAVREKFEALGLDARAFAGLKLAAVGGVTAQALREWGLEPDLVPDGEQSARGLLESWPPFDEVLDPINRVFLPRADIATDTLVAGLTDMGWEVDDVTAYRTVRAAPPAAEVREAIKGGAFDAVCFTSSSTVRNLVGIAGKPHPGTVVACIGPATAKAAQEHGLRVDVVAPEPSATSLVDALAEHARALVAQAQSEGEEFVRPSRRKPVARRPRSRR